MDRKALGKKKWVLWIVGAGIGVISMTVGIRYGMFPSKGGHSKTAAVHDATHTSGHAASQAAQKESHKDSKTVSTHSSLFSGIFEAWTSVQTKVDALRVAEQTSERLRTENAYLRLKLESLQFSCKGQDAAEVTRKVGLKLSRETGSRVGRNLASIHYTPPSNLLPKQLYTLGVSYFSSRDDEKAAVIFTFLTGLEDSEEFKTPKNFLITGITWYRLNNFELADYYFDRILRKADAPVVVSADPERPEVRETARFEAQARLWKGLTAAKLGKNTKAQFWLRELVDHHPHSMEAKWVNPGSKHTEEVDRAPASDESD